MKIATFSKLLLLVLCFSQLLSAQSTKKVVVEDITGTWCGLCPAGAETFNNILADYENVIPVGVHISDPLATEFGEELSDAYSGGGVNVFMLDRYLFPGEDFIQFSFQYDPIQEHLEERLDSSSPVAISFEEVSFNQATNELMVKVRADVLTDLPESDLRFNLWVTEDLIEYDQASFFNYESGSPFEGMGNPIPDFSHRNVLRAALGGAWGNEGSLYTPCFEDMSFYHIYTLTLEEDWDLDNLSIIGMVQQFELLNTQREILNSEFMDLTDAIALFEEVEEEPENPILSTENISNTEDVVEPILSFDNKNHKLYISCYIDETAFTQVDIYNIHGQKMTTLRNEVMNKGLHQIEYLISPEMFNNGLYLVHIESDGKFAGSKTFSYQGR